MKTTEHQCDCVFCREIGGSRNTNFATRYPEISSRIVGETEHLVAFPCIGQLAKGHFLVAPKSHLTTFRDSMRLCPDLWTEFYELVQSVHGLLDIDLSGVDPISRTLYCSPRRSPRCPDRISLSRHIRRNFVSKWSNSSRLVANPAN